MALSLKPNTSVCPTVDAEATRQKLSTPRFRIRACQVGNTEYGDPKSSGRITPYRSDLGIMETSSAKGSADQTVGPRE